MKVANLLGPCSVVFAELMSICEASGAQLSTPSASEVAGLLIFGGMAANNMSPSSFDKEQIFGMAEKEMEYRVELFNKMTQTCFNKCVDNRYKESELNMGENSCIDRCVSKYWHVTNLIGQLLGSGRPPI
ncbi:hypothetical protein RJT34_22309 [Clitoria ternatea]|uniref:Mitochondrial import inner membrane translocase subunit n=1 Tax=Clitoria ternatea TaxID=43366 RepID=A0AAN9P6B7_CLITE